MTGPSHTNKAVIQYERTFCLSTASTAPTSDSDSAGAISRPRRNRIAPSLPSISPSVGSTLTPAGASALYVATVAAESTRSAYASG